jgi:hypothetical protein
MTKRDFARVLTLISTLTVVACAPTPPNDVRTAGFNNFDQYEQQRVQVQQQPLGSVPAQQGAAQAQAVRPIPITTESTRALIESGQLQELQRQQAAQRTAGTAAANSGVEPLQASPSNPAPVQLSNAGISNENDFNAVSARETIESDAARLQRNREQYRVIQPTALPNRTGAGGPNIVEYALRTQNSVGQQLYTRRGFNKAARFARNCAVYPSADAAQADFLARGGPRRDRKGLDPDGDGFACNWDPRPFRLAVQN